MGIERRILTFVNILRHIMHCFIILLYPTSRESNVPDQHIIIIAIIIIKPTRKPCGKRVQILSPYTFKIIILMKNIWNR